MGVSKRNLIAGLVGMAILLISVLVFAQVNAAPHFEMREHVQQTE